MDETPESGEADLDDWLRYQDDDEPKKRSWGWLDSLAVGLALVTLVGLVLLWPGERDADTTAALSTLGVPSQFHAADVVAVELTSCAGTDIECTSVNFELTAGPDIGYVHTQEFPDSPTTPSFTVGQRVVMSYRPAESTIDATTTRQCSFDPEQDCTVLTLVIGKGARPAVVDHELFPGQEDVSFFPGAKVVVDYIEGDGGVLEVFNVEAQSPSRQYRFADFQRRGLLVWLVVLFAAVVVVLGRWRGVAALGGLAASIGVLLLFVLPAILDGQSPVWVAVFGSAAIAFPALYLAHGFNRMTTVAVVGTMAALTATALLSAVAVGLSEFTGFTTDETSLLSLFGDIDTRGLLLAGIVLGAAGAIDDVTVTQASAVWQLRAANPAMSISELYRRGLHVGRDHIASLVNTLLLAYAGASLPLMVLFVLSEQSLGTVANSEVVAVEIVRTLVGSIGLVAAVPLTTWLASIAADGSETPH